MPKKIIYLVQARVKQSKHALNAWKSLKTFEERPTAWLEEQKCLDPETEFKVIPIEYHFRRE